MFDLFASSIGSPDSRYQEGHLTKTGVREMYTRLLTRALFAALACAAAMPGMASAAMVMRGQKLQPFTLHSTDIGAASVAVSGDWIAAFVRATPTSGSGGISLFHRDAGGWAFAQSIVPPDDEMCIDSLAMTDNLLVVACPTAYDAEHASNMGVVTVYTLFEGEWQLSQTITSSTGFYGNPGFGSSLAIADNKLFISYTGFSFLPDSPILGDVEIYDLSALPATYEMQVLPDDTAANSNFGSSLAIKGNMLAVGANNQAIDGVGQSVGAVYTFTQGEGEWVQGSRLTSAQPQAYDAFPSALAFAQYHLIAGSATNDAQNTDGSLGAAFTYGTTQGQMQMTGVLTPNEAQTDTLFGQSLATMGGVVFVGEPSGGPGGHVHVYNSTALGWTHSSTLTLADPQGGDQFGYALASDGKTLVVTAPEMPPLNSPFVMVYDAPPADQIFGDGVEP
jgi:FG-GAP repeat